MVHTNDFEYEELLECAVSNSIFVCIYKEPRQVIKIPLHNLKEQHENPYLYWLQSVLRAKLDLVTNS